MMTFVRIGVGSAYVGTIGYYEELPAVGEARTARIFYTVHLSTIFTHLYR